MSTITRDPGPPAPVPTATPPTASESARRVVGALSRAYGHFALLLDESFSVLWASETVHEIFGWPEAPSIDVVGSVHPDDLDLVLGAIDYHQENAGEYQRFEATWRPDVTTLRVAHTDGSWVVCDVSVFNHLADPEIAALLVVGRLTDDRSDLALAIDLLGSGASLHEVLPVVARLVDRTIDGARCQVVWWDETADWVISAPGAPELPSPPAGLVSQMLRTGELVVSTDLELVDHATIDADFGAVWVVPVTAPGGDSVVGCLVVWNRLQLTFINGPQQPIHQAVRLASLAIVDHHAKAALRWEASHDSLTALRNRAGFDSEVSGAGPSCALLYVDLDDFKVINDRLGHQAGDAVLVEVARRIRAVVRDHDTVGRLGGDEFAVLCPDLDDPELADDIARRVVEAVCRPISVGGVPVQVGASVGVAFGGHRDDRASLIRQADEALYRAKSAGKNRVVVSPHPGQASEGG